MANTAIVTGAGTGVGRSAALALLADGWNVALAGRRADALQETADMANAGDRVLIVPSDITSADQVDSLVDQTVAKFGRLDMLFNNAGGNVPGRTIDEIPVEDWQQIVDVNLTGSFLCARAAFRQMRAQSPQGGRIINNGSISAHAPRPGSVPYTTTKHAITGLTKTISLDGRPFDIVCSQIDIGNAATPMTERMPEGVPQADGSVRAEPVMDIEHIGDAIVHMSNLPLSANVQFMTIMATKMPFVGRG